MHGIVVYGSAGLSLIVRGILVSENIRFSRRSGEDYAHVQAMSTVPISIPGFLFSASSLSQSSAHAIIPFETIPLERGSYTRGPAHRALNVYTLSLGVVMVGKLVLYTHAWTPSARVVLVCLADRARPLVAKLGTRI